MGVRRVAVNCGVPVGSGTIGSLHLSTNVDGLTAVANCDNLAPVVGDCMMDGALNVSSGHACPLCHACSLNLDVRFWPLAIVGECVGVLVITLTAVVASYLARSPESRLCRRSVCGGTGGVCVGTITILCGCVNNDTSDRNLRKAYHKVCSCGALAASRTVVPVHNNS